MVASDATPETFGLNSGIASKPLTPLYSVMPRRRPVIEAFASLVLPPLPAPSTKVGDFTNFELLNKESKAFRPVGLGFEERLPSPPGPLHVPVLWPPDAGLLPGSQFFPTDFMLFMMSVRSASLRSRLSILESSPPGWEYPSPSVPSTYSVGTGTIEFVDRDKK